MSWGGHSPGYEPRMKVPPGDTAGTVEQLLLLIPPPATGLMVSRAPLRVSDERTEWVRRAHLELSQQDMSFANDRAPLLHRSPGLALGFLPHILPLC